VISDEVTIRNVEPTKNDDERLVIVLMNSFIGKVDKIYSEKYAEL